MIIMLRKKRTKLLLNFFMIFILTRVRRNYEISPSSGVENLCGDITSTTCARRWCFYSSLSIPS